MTEAFPAGSPPSPERPPEGETRVQAMQRRINAVADLPEVKALGGISTTQHMDQLIDPATGLMGSVEAASQDIRRTLGALYSDSRYVIQATMTARGRTRMFVEPFQFALKDGRMMKPDEPVGALDSFFERINKLPRRPTAAHLTDGQVELAYNAAVCGVATQHVENSVTTYVNELQARLARGFDGSAVSPAQPLNDRVLHRAATRYVDAVDGSLDIIESLTQPQHEARGSAEHAAQLEQALKTLRATKPRSESEIRTILLDGLKAEAGVVMSAGEIEAELKRIMNVYTTEVGVELDKKLAEWCQVPVIEWAALPAAARVEINTRIQDGVKQGLSHRRAVGQVLQTLHDDTSSGSADQADYRRMAVSYARSKLARE